MNSLIFTVMVRYLNPILWIVAIWLLLRGHNYPGGGFIAGLVAASTVILKALSSGWSSISPRIRNNLFEIAGTGLLIAIFSGLLAMFIGNPFMTGRWTTFLKIDLGSPVLFDFGVFIVVYGVVITCTGLLIEEEDNI